jgi:tRNA dimethylallyltransferase
LLIVLLGPTAVGKTALSLQLAEKFNGEIVSADSRLIYQGMDIGTAKPSRAERASVPHHLVDVAAPDERWSLADYQAAAYQAIVEIHSRGKIPFLVGGTGQYIKSVVEGWQIPILASQTGMREVLTEWGNRISPSHLHRALAQVDPAAAADIESNNLRRTVRALEVIFSTGRLFSGQSRRRSPRFECLQLGLIRPRPELYERIDARIDGMLQEGWLQEVSSLLDSGYAGNLSSMSAIGYKQLCDHLAGETSLKTALMLTKRATRQFVRRQANWFKQDDPKIQWFDADQTQESIYRHVERFLRHPTDWYNETTP